MSDRLDAHFRTVAAMRQPSDYALATGDRSEGPASDVVGFCPRCRTTVVAAPDSDPPACELCDARLDVR